MTKLHTQEVRDMIRDLLNEMDSIPRDLPEFDPAEFLELCFEEAQRRSSQNSRWPFLNTIKVTLSEFQTWGKIPNLADEVKRRQEVRKGAAVGRRIQQKYQVGFALIPISIAMYFLLTPSFQSPEKSFGFFFGSLAFPGVVAVTQFFSAVFGRIARIIASKLHESCNLFEPIEQARAAALDTDFYLAHAVNSVGTLLAISSITLLATFLNKTTPWGLQHYTSNPVILILGEVVRFTALILIPAFAWELTGIAKVRIGLKGNRGTFWAR